MANKKVVIIGAGPGGYRAAFMASDLKMDVTLIDPEVNPGGVCLYRGCIPTKALLHLAKVKNDALKASEWGVSFDEPKIDIKKVRNWKNSVVDTLTNGLGSLSKSRKINYIRGTAHFISSDKVQVKKEKGENEEITFDNAIIATGTSPLPLPGVEIKSDRVMYSKQALDLEDIPKNLLVIGGGYIGMEMSAIYKALGSKISIAEMLDNFMPGMDKDLVSVFKRTNKTLFEDTFLKTKVTNLKETGKKIEATLESKNGEKTKKKYDKVLVAIGLKPNTQNLGLDKTKVKTDEKGFIKTDVRKQTTDEKIYAIGDVAGGALLAHKASHEGRVAAEAIAGEKTEFDARTIPAVVYTDPEIAVSGLSEQEAKEKDINYKAIKFPWSASGRAIAMGEKSGFTKMLIDPDTEQILGVGIVGQHAGDLISEAALAIEMAAVASDLSLTIHPHPTLSETIMEAAEKFYGHPVHTVRVLGESVE